MGFKQMACATLVLAAMAAPAVAGEGKISGDVFGDMYWFAANHDSTLEDQSGLWFRRINLSYDYKYSPTYSARVRFEALSPGDFSADSMVPYMKDAWVKWSSGTHGIILGLQQTPLSNLVETVWGYRSIERGPGDLHGFGGSRDIGFGAQGTVGANQLFGYHLLFGNGGGTKAEDNSKKKLMLALSVKPTDELVLEVYGDYEDRIDEADRKTMQVFAGYMASRFRAGVQYTRQDRNEPADEDLELPIISGFVAANLSEKMWLFGRVDHLTEPNPQGDKIAYVPMDTGSAPTYVVGGLDWTLHEEKNDAGKLIADVHLMPNVEAVFYDEPEAGGSAPDTDVIPRVTFQFRF